MDDKYMFDKIIDRIDKSDDKLDTKIEKIYTSISKGNADISKCKIDINSVQRDLSNHLNNKKDESVALKRRTTIAFGIMGIALTTYALIH